MHQNKIFPTTGCDQIFPLFDCLMLTVLVTKNYRFLPLLQRTIVMEIYNHLLTLKERLIINKLQSVYFYLSKQKKL